MLDFFILLFKFCQFYLLVTFLPNNPHKKYSKHRLIKFKRISCNYWKKNFLIQSRNKFRIDSWLVQGLTSVVSVTYERPLRYNKTLYDHSRCSHFFLSWFVGTNENTNGSYISVPSYLDSFSLIPFLLRFSLLNVSRLCCLCCSTIMNFKTAGR